MPMRDFPEILSQGILVGIILVGRLGAIRVPNTDARCTASEAVRYTWFCVATLFYTTPSGTIYLSTNRDIQESSATKLTWNNYTKYWIQSSGPTGQFRAAMAKELLSSRSMRPTRS